MKNYKSIYGEIEKPQMKELKKHKCKIEKHTNEEIRKSINDGIEKPQMKKLKKHK